MVVSVAQHERFLRQMHCVVSDSYPVTLHHCHGGSMLSLGPRFPNPGWAQRNNPFFQIPLHASYHIGQFGIDAGMGVETWERTFGRQLDFLAMVNADLPYDIFEQAELWQANNRKPLRQLGLPMPGQGE